jgi:flavin reductase (DIM6/NTAB) family NADH-FMN oxidoreductase RutF
MSSKPLPARSQTIDKELFCRTCARFTTGITIVTALDAQGSPHGMTANSFTSVSLNPPMVLVCVDHRANVLEHYRKSGYLGINVLSEEQQDLSTVFARRGQDRFNGVEWFAGETGVPLFPGVLASFECVLTQSVEAGDHDVLIAEVLSATHRDGRPLVYFGSGYHKLG